MIDAADKMEFKRCSICGELKPLTEFYSQLKKSKTKGEYVYHNPECKECSRKRSRNYYKENLKRAKRARQLWHRKNAQRVREEKKKYRLENLERVKEKDRKYRKSARGKKKYQQYNQRRKQKEHNITNNEWVACKEFFSYCCAYCGMTENDHKRKYQQQLHKEHIIHDGRNDIKNCVPSCRECNAEKRTYSLNNWYNTKNPKYTYERYKKIYQWLRYEVHKHVERKNK